MFRDGGPPNGGNERREILGDRVPHAPRLVNRARFHEREHVNLRLVDADRGRNRHGILDGEQADAVLVVLRELVEEGQHVSAQRVGLHDARKDADVLRRRSPHHGHIVRAQRRLHSRAGKGREGGVRK